MPYEQLEIGPVPAEESCQQVGTDSYDSVAARNECSRFIRLIEQTFPHRPLGASLRVTSNPHDFGTYYEVAVRYDPDNAEAVEYAFAVEADAPATWNDTKKREWKQAAK